MKRVRRLATILVSGTHLCQPSVKVETGLSVWKVVDQDNPVHWTQREHVYIYQRNDEKKVDFLSMTWTMPCTEQIKVIFLFIKETRRLTSCWWHGQCHALNRGSTFFLSKNWDDTCTEQREHAFYQRIERARALNRGSTLFNFYQWIEMARALNRGSTLFINELRWHVHWTEGARFLYQRNRGRRLKNPCTKSDPRHTGKMFTFWCQ